jgi:preprotein translocase subunit SecG
MSFIIGLLTFVLVVDCVLLILLVLMQLPKKEAGMGTAFGGAATDALFGAGTGNVLTKVTKYSAICFFVLSLGLSVINAQIAKHNRSSLKNLVKSAPAATNAPAPAPAPAVTPSNLLQSLSVETNVARTAATNQPAK